MICVDVNECHQDEPVCHKHAQCVNTEGKYSCECMKGYYGSGLQCQGRHYYTTYIVQYACVYVINYILCWPIASHVTSYMLEVLHWLPVWQRIEYRVASLMWLCQLGLTPIYLIDLCRSVSGITSGRSLRSAGSPLSLVCSYHSHANPCF